ncbi:hypothetical protein C1645_829546 [Glomus cerebriforme]|uniref:Secreted protein n=1 Tax=Glomus cerebriforme TaxID=658196 RepID=A0A397SJC8_9GLOM|nr:hypothetical protein C1645_829546 [Glomus cerebriforme]
MSSLKLLATTSVITIIMSNVSRAAHPRQDPYKMEVQRNSNHNFNNQFQNQIKPKYSTFSRYGDVELTTVRKTTKSKKLKSSRRK